MTESPIDRLSLAFSNRNPRAAFQTLAELLEDLLSVEPTFEGFEHPLGFLRIPIGADSAGLRYFVHRWISGDRCVQQPAWLVHRHAWDLESFVVSGELEDRQWRRASREGGFGLYVADVDSTTSVLSRTDEGLELEPIGTEPRRAGEFYRVDIGSFHESVVAPGTDCITLVRVGQRLRSNSEVQGPVSGPQSVSYSRNRMSSSDVRCLLGDAMKVALEFEQ